MKTNVFLLVLCLSALSVNAQTRLYWSASCLTFARMAGATKAMSVTSTSVANPTSTTTGLFQGTVNAGTGALTPNNSTYFNDPIVKGTYPIAVSAYGYLYTISGDTDPFSNSGIIQMVSKSAAAFDSNLPANLPLHDLNGSGSDADIQILALGIAPSGNGAFVYEETGDQLVAGFTAGADGSVSWNTSKIIHFNNTDNPGLWINYVDIADIAFDDAGNLYVLAVRYQEDTYDPQTVIYSVPAGAMNGATMEADLKWALTDNKNISASWNRTDGLAYASGTFYLAQSYSDDYTNYTSYITAFQAPPTGTALVLPDTYTVLTGYCAIKDLAAVPETTLPVDFGAVAASYKNGHLQVNWQTMHEMNNDHFEIEVSGDGKSFHSIGQVASKATDGYSNLKLEYSFITSGGAMGALLGLFPVGLLLLFGRRKKNMLLLAMGLGIITLIQAGCTKNSDLQYKTDSEIFVRIVQVDKDGTTTYSKVVQVVKK